MPEADDHDLDLTVHMVPKTAAALMASDQLWFTELFFSGSAQWLIEKCGGSSLHICLVNILFPAPFSPTAMLALLQFWCFDIYAPSWMLTVYQAVDSHILFDLLAGLSLHSTVCFKVRYMRTQVARSSLLKVLLELLVVLCATCFSFLVAFPRLFHHCRRKEPGWQCMP